VNRKRKIEWIPLSVRLEPSASARLKVLAEANHRTVTDELRRIVDEAVAHIDEPSGGGEPLQQAA
jgi:plasmid stability protein